MLQDTWVEIFLSFSVLPLHKAKMTEYLPITCISFVHLVIIGEYFAEKHSMCENPNWQNITERST